MNRTTILVVGKNDFLHTGNEWDVVTVADTETAIEKFHQVDFDAVVFSNTIQDDVVKLSKLFLFQQPDLILLQNNNDDVITEQIKTALQKRDATSKPSFSFVDDALKTAALPITIQ
ncbi:hypothetical protein [Ferruginibacter sp. SUN106]|uniref:hypothetical protein n=1 Tax=Ferruginibacter sp. SUN106 TaxID=2978348 RepID=UPI003D365A47